MVKANENNPCDKMMILKIRAKVQIIFIISVFFVGLCSKPLSAQDRENYHLKTVVIDPGHGGRDIGAPGRIKHEKDLVLEIALKTGQYIKEQHPGVEVIYTRKTDTLIGLDERAEIANKNKADLFISIHCNANENRNARGTETYVMGLHKSQSNLEVAKQENSAILYEEDYSRKYEGFEPQSAESYIIFSLIQNAYLEQSMKFASAVQKHFDRETGMKNRGVKQAGFIVLYKTATPRVLVETGFLSNPEQEKYLNSRQGQKKIAQSIARAFTDYKQQIESKSVMLASDTMAEKHQAPVRFRVQVAAANQPIPLDSDYFNGHENVREHNVSGQYKYTIGNFSSYQQVREFKQKIQKEFPGAFIVAFKHNQPIPVKKALSEINQ